MFDALCAALLENDARMAAYDLADIQEPAQVVRELVDEIQATLPIGRTEVGRQSSLWQLQGRLNATLCVIEQDERAEVIGEETLSDIIELSARRDTSLYAQQTLMRVGPGAASRWTEILLAVDTLGRSHFAAAHEFGISESLGYEVLAGRSRTGLHWFDQVCGMLNTIDPGFMARRDFPESIHCHYLEGQNGPTLWSMPYMPYLTAPYMDEADMPAWFFEDVNGGLIERSP